ncbi:MAG TPA: MarP family serine protease [Acidimicrobiales bacterium]|jgi:S1-C subfamily serine protease|nr:MarP family serine protease [Acidimicrobiales bacterium]
MDAFDLVILGVIVFAMVGGYSLGFLGRVISWLGMAAGVYIAVRILPSVLTHLTSASATTLLVVAVVILVAGAMIGQAIGLLAGAQLHRALPIGPARLVDRVVGAVFGALGVLALLWFLIPALAEIPGLPARAVTQSAISRFVSRDFPTPPSTFQLLSRLVGNGNPEVFSVLDPHTAGGPPPASSPLSPALTAAVEASTVKVEGQACGEIIEGSGFAVAPNLVVTNAHVVAGESKGNTSVLLPSGHTLPATVVLYDPYRDLALLSVPGLGETPLAVTAPKTAEIGAVFGHPEGQDRVAVMPAQVSVEESASGLDIYRNHNAKRAILVLAATLAHGDSGGALVNTGGQVIGVAFAISANSSGTAYAVNSSELNAVLQEPHTASVSTQSCLTSS